MHYLDKSFVVRANDRELTNVSDSKVAFGAFGLKSPTISTIHGRRLQMTGRPFERHALVWFKHDVRVQKPKLHSRTKLRLPSSVWKKVGKKDDPRKTLDRLTMKELIRTPISPAFWDKWKAPLRSKLVSKFASARTLPNGKSYFHSGHDLRAATGTPIRPMGKGRVVFAGKMVAAGNIVIVDHGLGVLSRYMHLSKILTKKDAVVDSKILIGRAGATGRVEGPHLHWDILWKGVALHPMKAVQFWNEQLSTN